MTLKNFIFFSDQSEHGTVAYRSQRDHDTSFRSIERPIRNSILYYNSNFPCNFNINCLFIDITTAPLAGQNDDQITITNIICLYNNIMICITINVTSETLAGQNNDQIIAFDNIQITNLIRIDIIYIILIFLLYYYLYYDYFYNRHYFASQNNEQISTTTNISYNLDMNSTVATNTRQNIMFTILQEYEVFYLIQIIFLVCLAISFQIVVNILDLGH